MYACISTNTYCFEIYYIFLEKYWWALSNTSLIVWICPAIHEISANKTFIVTNSLISQSFVIAFVHSAYMQIALIWSFLEQLSLWKLVHWLWWYKLNEVCDIVTSKFPETILIYRHFLALHIFIKGLSVDFQMWYTSYLTSLEVTASEHELLANKIL